MGQPLKCVLLLSLEEIALRKLVAILWNGSYILASRMKFRYQESSIIKQDTIIDSIKDKIMKLKLPESLTKQMVDIIRPIGLEIRRWEDFQRKTFNLSPIEIFEHYSAKLCFTTAGTVDDRRMAQEIVHCDKITVAQRYLIACSYWLEDYIPLLWKELREENKEFFSRKNLVARGLEFSWPHIFKGKLSKLECSLRKSDRNLTSFNQWAFEHSARKGNKSAAEYFFQKLSHEEREVSLMRSARNAASTILFVEDHVREELRNFLHYLLLLMTPEQQTEIVKAYPVRVMSCFLDWSRRELFSENAGLIWPFLPPSQYEDLLHTYFTYSVIHCPELFKQSPLDFKKYVVGSNHLCDYFSVHFLKVFFNSEDSESIKAMFRCANVAWRVKLLFDRNVLGLFHNNIARDKWHLVEVCLREVTLSRQDRKRLKKIFLRCLNERCFSYFCIDSSSGTRKVLPMNDRDPKLKSFFDFLDRTDTSAEEGKKCQKRKLENCSPE